MPIYDVLMTVLLLAAVVGMVINHRTGWLASHVAQAPRSPRRSENPAHSRRGLLDSDDRPVDLMQSSTTPHD